MIPVLTINNKWGSFDQANNGVLTPRWNDPTVNDWIARHSGIQKTIYNLTLIAEALDDATRDNYILIKRRHLAKIADNARDLFKMEFARYLDAGNPEHVAKQKAFKMADEYKKKMLEAHNKQFPDEMTYEQAIHLIKVERIHEKQKKKKIKGDDF